MINNASKLYGKLLNKYETQNNKFPEDRKKMITVLNKPEMLPLSFIEGDLQQMTALECDEQPEKAIAERLKLNPRKIQRETNKQEQD